MEYNNLPKFRTAVGGFNRMDVVSYIESLSLQNQQTLKKLQEENSDLRRQIAQYEAASAPSELEEAAAEPGNCGAGSAGSGSHCARRAGNSIFKGTGACRISPRRGR